MLRLLNNYFRRFEYQIESSGTLINIVLPILIYLVSGGIIFGFHTYSVFTLILNTIFRFILLVITSIGFIKLQTYLHRYILDTKNIENPDSNTDSDPNSYPDQKVNASLTNLTTLVLMSCIFFFIPHIRTLFSVWAFPLSIMMYVLRTPMSPLVDIIRLQSPDTFYDYYHIEIPFILSIALACALETLWVSMFRPMVCIFFMIATLVPSLTEQIDCSSLSRSSADTVDGDRILRPVILTSHLLWLTTSSTVQTVGGFYLLLFASLTGLTVWIRDRYIRIVDTSMSNRRSVLVQKIRTFHNSFYRFWQDTFEVTGYAQDRKISIFLFILKCIVFYPIHTTLSIISNIVSGRKKPSILYIRTIDLLIMLWASIPIQYADRYYLGTLLIMYNLFDPWTHHLFQILNLDRERADTSIRFDTDQRGQNITTDSSLSDVPSNVLIDVGLSEDTASDLSENVVLSEVTDESTIISTYQSRPVHRKRKKQW